MDALRFLAAFLVLLSHSRNDFFMPFGELPVEQQNIFTVVCYFVARLGHEAVIVFFILSGFLVGGIGLERIFKGTFNATSYFIERFVRIYLPLFASIVLFYFTCLLLGDEFNWLTAIGNLFNLQGVCCDSLVSPYWSLAYEVWFYIILGGFGLVISSKSVASKAIGLVLLFVSGFIFTSGLEFFYLYLWLLGAASYLALPSRCNKLILFYAGGACVFFVVLYQLSTDSNSLILPFEFPSWLSSKVLELLLAIHICIFVQQIIGIIPKHSIGLKLDNLFHKLADFSYTLYLSHRIIFLILFAYFFEKGTYEFNILSIILYLLFVAISFISCYLLYLVSERYTGYVKLIVKDYFKIL